MIQIKKVSSIKSEVNKRGKKRYRYIEYTAWSVVEDG